MAIGQGALESVVVTRLDLASLTGKRIFLTGHTGFKGSWMTALLTRLGAQVFGYALPPTGDQNLYDLADVESLVTGSTIADVRDRTSLMSAMREAAPDLAIHMAAQAFVRRSYADPVGTWDVNVMGTVNVLDAVRQLVGVAGVIVVTTDKCYENRGWDWGYREVDPLGGHDPYSASKAAAELVVRSYRQSFFNEAKVPVVSVRAGNVIGGGDWSEDRLIPDAARAAASGQPLVIRNPNATRPWQHVLDCLSGYVAVAAKAVNEPDALADAYNFGPSADDNVAVSDVLARLQDNWPELTWEAEQAVKKGPHEAALLYLDSSRARRQLGWRPRWGLDQALAETARWYREVQREPSAARQMTMTQIQEFLA